MNFEIKRTQEKEMKRYKTLYIKLDLVDKIYEITREHKTSWNNVVISIIESRLNSE